MPHLRPPRFRRRTLREVAGASFRDSTHLSQRYLRILGPALLAVGLPLFAIDWMQSFRLGWPGFIGARLLIFGLVVTAIAALAHLHEMQKSRSL